MRKNPTRQCCNSLLVALKGMDIPPHRRCIVPVMRLNLKIYTFRKKKNKCILYACTSGCPSGFSSPRCSCIERWMAMGHKALLSSRFERARGVVSNEGGGLEMRGWWGGEKSPGISHLSNGGVVCMSRRAPLLCKNKEMQRGGVPALPCYRYTRNLK